MRNFRIIIIEDKNYGDKTIVRLLTLKCVDDFFASISDDRREIRAVVLRTKTGVGVGRDSETEIARRTAILINHRNFTQNASASIRSFYDTGLICAITAIDGKWRS